MVPDLPASRIVIHRCMSGELILEDENRYRFVHVDGGHGFEACYGDLNLVGEHVLPGGVIAVDDYEHPKLPDVKKAVDRYLGEHAEFRAMADLNRHGEWGRKIYLLRGLEPPASES